MGAPFIISAFAAYTLGRIAQKLLPEPEVTPLQDEKPTTRSTRGSYAPLLIGTRRIGSIIAWAGNRTIVRENESSGGKGITGNQGEVQQDTYFEDAAHVLGVGPGYSISRMWANGQKLKFNNGNPITIDSHPSGSTIDVSSKEGSFGQMEIYWGDSAQDVDYWLGAQIGITSKWPFLIRANWVQCRLGGFAVWPTIEYELTVKPYNTTLAQTSSWMSNGPGPANNPYNLLGVSNSTDVGGASPPYFKIWANGSDATGEFPANGYAEVKGQVDPLVNRIWPIASSSYDSAETYLETTGNFTTAPDASTLKDLQLWTESIPSRMSVTTISGGPPSQYPGGFTNLDGDIFEIDFNNPGFALGSRGYLFHNTINAGGGEAFFSTGAQRLVFYIKGLGPNQQWTPNVSFGFGAGPSGIISTDITGGVFDLPGGVAYNATDFEGSVSTINDAQNDWARVVVTFRTGDDDDGSITASDRRQIWISLPEPDTIGTYTIRVFFDQNTNENFLKEDDGTLRTGITTIYLDEPLLGAVSDKGTIDALVEGNGAAGPNPAHILEQLLFETFPHGVGKSRTYWDLDSLEALGVTAEAEGARTHVLLDNAKTAEGAIAEILQDLQGYIAWDRINGKYVFGLVRDASNDTLPEIPLDLLATPSPSRKQRHSPRVPTQITFGFSNRDLQYRTDTRPVDNDALAGIYNNRDTDNIKVPTATDVFYAEQVAERRQLEVMVPPHAYQMTGLRECKLITPGRPITIEGIDEVIRLTESDYNHDTGKTRMEGLTDVYSRAETFTNPLGMPDFDGGGGPAAAQVDLYDAVWELPPFLARGTVSLMVARLRAHQGVSSASIWISDDDATFRKVANRVPYCSGGVLLQDIPATGDKLLSNELRAPIISAVGDDILSISQVLSDKEWYEGRQLCLIGNEVFYLRKLTASGSGTYKLDGLVRARLGSSMQAHSTGDPVFIFPASNVHRIRDLLLAPGNPIYVKVVPAGMTLDEVSSFSHTLTGEGIRPLTPTSLITRHARNCYKTGQNIDLHWNYYDLSSYGARNGSGFQAAGEPLEEDVAPTGFFRLRFYDGTTLLRTEEITVNSYKYTNANIVADSGGEPTIDVELEHVYNGYRSGKATLTVVKL